MIFSEYELIMLYHEKNEDATKILFEKYQKLINKKLNNYKVVIEKLRIDRSLLYGDCLEIFNQALDTYNPNNNASFSTFVTTLINRKIKKEIIKSNRIKNQIFNNSISLDYTYDDSISLKEIIADTKEKDPFNLLYDFETVNELKKALEKKLSKCEIEVYKLQLQGLNAREIAKSLNKTLKQVDNAMQRIKRKIKELLEIN